MEKQFIISERTVIAILNYLKKRPYEEVEQGIIALRSLTQFTPSISVDPAPANEEPSK